MQDREANRRTRKALRITQTYKHLRHGLESKPRYTTSREGYKFRGVSEKESNGYS